MKSQNCGDGHLSDCELLERFRADADAAPALQPPRSEAWQRARQQACSVRLLLLDVDGVLTDGSVIYSGDVNEIKSFHIRDGFGIRLLREAGIKTGIITARSSAALDRRAQELHIDHVYQGVGRKLDVFDTLIRHLGLKPVETAYMGDDWLDLELLSRVGFAATVADAPVEIKNAVHYVTDRAGGRGAVREVAELILEARGLLAPLFSRYSGTDSLAAGGHAAGQ